MARLFNRAKMTISSTGTGNITLASATSGNQTFLDAGVSDGDVIRYIAEDASNAWEIGTAVVSSNSTVLARTVEESSNSDNALNLTSAAKVFIGVTAKDLDNAAPIFTATPPAALKLDTDGSTSVTLNAKAYDERGIPISYSWDAWLANGATIYDASSLPPQLASAPSINQSTGVYSLIGSNNNSNAGLMNFRVKASDGVKVATHVTTCNLTFFPQSANLFGRWDIGDSNSYSGSGTTWNDLSGNSRNLTIENGAYNSTSWGGNSLSTPVWEWTSDDSARIDLPDDLSSVKTYMVIWGFPTNSQSRQILINGNDSSQYIGYTHHVGSTTAITVGAHSGETISMNVNGNAISSITGQNVFNALQPGVLNMYVARGAQMPQATTTTTYADYGSYNHKHQLRAIIMWTVMLTNAEIKEVYDTFPSGSMATWDG